MKKISFSLVLAAAICCWMSLTTVAQQAYEPPLSNGAVVKLVRAGFREKTIIAIINSRPTSFNLAPDKLIELKRNGVSENIILAMLSQDESFVVAGDDWSTDWNSGGAGKTSREPGGMDIFGDSQGSKNESRAKGMRGGHEGERTTTGTATVRILRPPTEPGASSPKLEKTPTLTNESVIKLVDAGFSEGTIIKRIEESPADFDLSEAKLEELRRRRVTEPIIAAMTAAMKDESDPNQATPGKTKGN